MQHLQFNKNPWFMKNMKNLFFAFCMLAAYNTGFAQSNVLNAHTAAEIGDESIEEIYAKADGPIPYEYVNERDVIFQKKVWEVLPADQRQNLIYFFPWSQHRIAHHFGMFLKML